MSVAFLESLVGNLLEHKNLVCTRFIIDDGSLDDGAFHVRGTNLYLSLVFEEENLVELHVGAFGLGESLNEDFVASLYFELLACNFYDCEHFNKLFLSFNRKRLP